MARPILAPLLERFEKGYVPEPNSGCLIWIGTITSTGYGRISNGRGGKIIFAHRASWKLHRGEIPKGTLVCHKCDVPLCVNPDHLFIGSQRDNMTDCVMKKRDKETRKTHCKNGHQYDLENIYLVRRASGRFGRVCRQCSASANKRMRCRGNI